MRSKSGLGAGSRSGRRLPRLERERALHGRELVARSVSALRTLNEQAAARDAVAAQPPLIDAWPASAHAATQLVALRKSGVEGDATATVAESPSPVALATVLEDETRRAKRVAQLEQTSTKPELRCRLEAMLERGLAIAAFLVAEGGADSGRIMRLVAQVQRDSDDLHALDVTKIAAEASATAGMATVEAAEQTRAKQREVARLEVFRQVGAELAAAFTTYGPLLNTVFAGYEAFVAHLRRLIGEERTALQRQCLAAKEACDEMAARAAVAESTADKLKRELDACMTKLNAREEQTEEAAAHQRHLEHVAAESEFTVATLEHEKGVLARQILKLEREIEVLRKRLEQPERTIASLRGQLARKDETIAQIKALQESTLAENAAHKRQITLLALSRHSGGSGGATRDTLAEIAMLRKREVRADALVACLQGRVVVLENQLRLMGYTAPAPNASMTPRPKVVPLHGQLDEIPTTAAKLEEACRIIDQLRTDLEAARANAALLLSSVASREPAIAGVHAALDPAVVGPRRRWFRCLGEGPSVPVFLRATGRARNHKFGREAVKAHIREFFRARIIVVEDACCDVGAVFGEWLQVKYDKEAVNMGYSFYEALQWHPYDVDCFLFHKLLQRRIGINVWFQGYAVAENLRDVLLHRAADLGVPRLSKLQLAAAFGRFFSTCDDELVGILIQTVVGHFAGDAIDPAHLFLGTVPLAEAPLVTAVRAVDLVMRERMLLDLEAALLEDAAISAGIVTPQMTATALRVVDPQRPLEEVDRFLQGAFGAAVLDGVPVDDLEVPFSDRYAACEQKLELDEVMAVCERLTLFRHSKGVARTAPADA